ncbi:MAG: hypothetical protein EOR00_09230 [Mesorhizobium sp.]|uniref:hypothetical protein n=1 Tax=Mesorhizobium sp. TaxID=1871066 RepID=UPI000FE58BFB|nr:hypothetical protein [Mesorhizobium sp.]RWP19278.1 MAG: hypothetical protein EOR00_09230 [Mesorhizobium sp.]
MATFDELYRPASLKLERAKHHINDLNARINAFLAEEPFELVIIHDDHAGRRTHEIESKQAIPCGLSLIIGDAIHNLRSALDITLFGMIGATASYPWMVQFPFARNKDGLKAAIAKAEIALAGNDVVAVIEAAEPYGGGNELFHGLNVLDITDKHRLIIATGRNAQLSADDFAKIDPYLPISGPGILVFTGETNVIFDIKIHRMSRQARRANKGYAPTRHKPHIQPPFELAFGGGEPFAGQALVPTLVEITSKVECLCRDMCTAFLKP